MKPKRKPNSVGYTNALLEDIKDQFKAVLEATRPIPKMQEQIGTLAKKTDRIETNVDGMTQWKDDIKVIPSIFDEVGQLRIDMTWAKESLKDINKRLDTMEKSLRLLEHGTEEIDDLRSRVKKLERALNN